MKIAVISVLLIAGAVCSSAQSVVLFGDSFSDNGNGYAGNAKFVLRTSDVYPQEPYFSGRWSNGPTWIEVAADQLAANLTDYGAGGATTGLVPAQVPLLPVGFANLTVPTTVLSPTLFQQLNSHYLATNNGPLDPDALYIVFIGANDYLSIVFARTGVTAAQVVANVEEALSQLADRGARKFVLGTQPPINTLPTFSDPMYGTYPAADIAELAAQVMENNALTEELAASFPESHAGTNVTVFDFAGAFAQVMSNASNLGLTNTMTPCYVTAPILTLSENNAPIAQPIGLGNGTECASPASHLFWDQFHPNSMVHNQIGQIFLQQHGGLVSAPPPPTST